MERATREIGGPIAHGYLTLSLIPFLGQGMLPVKGVTRGINYGSDKASASSTWSGSASACACARS